MIYSKFLFIALIVLSAPSFAQVNYTIDEEGNYIYKEADEDSGAIIYDEATSDGTDKIQSPGVVKSDSTGAYYYKVDQEISKNAVHVKFAKLDSPEIVSKKGLGFSDIYDTDSLTAVLIDYEWKTFNFFGKLGLIFGSGIMSTTGKGRFESDLSEVAEEEYTFYAFPNHLSLIYRFQFSEDQIFIPYAMAGTGYFLIVETRDDNAKTNFVGAATAVGGGGILFSLNSFDKSSSYELGSEYGIRDIFLNLDYRRYQGLSDIDFTSNVINFGVTVDF